MALNPVQHTCGVERGDSVSLCLTAIHDSVVRPLHKNLSAMNTGIFQQGLDYGSRNSYASNGESSLCNSNGGYSLKHA